MTAYCLSMAEQPSGGEEALWPDTRMPEPPRHLLRNGCIGIAIVILVVGTFIGVTALTGLPGPGPLRRYPLHDLQTLAARVNRSEPGTASIDLLRSRVRINPTVLSCQQSMLVGPDGHTPMPLSPEESRMAEASGPLITGPHSCPIH